MAQVSSTEGWQVLLIGGSSGTGKTRTARQLSSEYGVPLLLVDDVRIALQASTTPSTHPELHTFVSPGTAAFQSPDSVFRGLKDVAESMEPALRAIISHHLVVEGAGPVVLEGDGILPRLASAAYLSGLPEFPSAVDDWQVQGLFLIEGDRDRLEANMKVRGRGFESMSLAEQSALVGGSYRFGQTLLEQAREYRVESVAADQAEARLRDLFEARQPVEI